MLTAKVKISNAKQAAQKIRRLAKGLASEVARALFQEVEVEVTEVKQRTPVRTGVLRATVHQIVPTVRGNTITTMIVCGGPAAAYAIYVHEDLEAIHKVGQAKFLESVILESRAYIAARVAKRIDINKAAEE